MGEVKLFDTLDALLAFAIEDGRPFEHFPTKSNKFIARFLPGTAAVQYSANPENVKETISGNLGTFFVSKTNGGETVLYSFVKESSEEKAIGELLLEEYISTAKTNLIGQLSFKEVWNLWSADRKTFDKYEKDLKLSRFVDEPELFNTTDVDFLRKVGKDNVDQREAMIALRNGNLALLDTAYEKSKIQWSDSFLLDSFLLGHKKYLLGEKTIKQELLEELLIIDLSEEDAAAIYEKIGDLEIKAVTVRKILFCKNPLGKLMRSNYKKFISDQGYFQFFE